MEDYHMNFPPSTNHVPQGVSSQIPLLHETEAWKVLRVFLLEPFAYCHWMPLMHLRFPLCIPTEMVRDDDIYYHNMY